MPPALERPEYLSPSSIETFQQCPLKYKLSKIDKLEEGQEEYHIRGKFVHEVLEELFKLPADERTLATAMAIMRRVWTQKPTDEDGNELPSWEEQAIEIGLTEQEIKMMRWKSRWGVENYFQMEDPALITPGGIETALLVEIEGVPIKGFVDRWDPFDEGVRVVDYKTGRVPWKKDYDKKFQQLMIYADGLTVLTGLPARELNLLYVKDGVRLKKTVRQSDLDTMRQTLTDTWTAVTVRCEKGEFEPKVNQFCNWCAFKPICPAWSDS